PGRADRVSALLAMPRFARISAAGGAARRSRRHRPPQERQPMVRLQSNGVRRQPAGPRRMRGLVSSPALASRAAGGGAIAFHALQREPRSANTSLPADLPMKIVLKARRATASADTEGFA